MPVAKHTSRLPPLNALRAFEAAARYLNFRIAAKELGVTQGAVAQQVRGLEATLGVQLFERLPRTLALTSEGRTYLPAVRRAFELIADATERLRPQQSTLTISVTPSFAAKWLIPKLGAFTQANPELDVHIVATESMSNFQSDGVDIAIRHGQPPHGTGLVAELLFPAEIFAVCSPALLRGKYPLRTWRDIAHFVLLHDAHGLWPEYLEALADGMHVTAVRAQTFSQSSLAIDAAVAGLGLALASHPLVEQDIAAGRLVRPFDLTIKGPIGFYFVSPRRQRKATLVKLMRDWLISQAMPASGSKVK